MADIRPGYLGELESWCNTNLDKFMMRSAGDWGDCSCPYHEDKKPSARVSFDRAPGRLFCESPGCQASGKGVWIDQAAKACNLQEAPPKTDFKPKAKKKKARDPNDMSDPFNWPIVKTYTYRDVNGREYAKVFRKAEPGGTGKTFFQKFYNPETGKWETKQGDRPHIMWKLPELASAKRGSAIFVVEGEKDVEALEAWGLKATCPITGGGGGHKVKDWSVLAGQKVVIITDNDEPGRILVKRILPKIHAVAEAVKVVDLCDDPELSWNKVIKTNRENGKKIRQPDEGKDFSDWVAEGGTKERLKKLLDATEPVTEPPPPPDSENKPEVVVNGRDPELVDAEILNILSDTGKFFTRAGSVVVIDTDSFGHPAITTVDKARMAKEITEAMALVNVKYVKDEKVKSFVRPDYAVVSAALVGGVKTFMPLVKIVEIPFFDKSGRLVCQPGYDMETAVWYEPFDSTLKIDMSPSKESVQKSIQFLKEELLKEFAFESDTDSTHAIISAIQPFLSEYVSAPSPAYLFQANRSGSGKTYLAQCLSSISSFTGADMVVEIKKNDDEVRKAVDACLFSGSTQILLDNIESQMRWPWFQGYTTGDVLKPRVLNRSETRTIINRHWWAVTANTPNLYHDTVRRMVPIKLHIEEEDPSDRKFRRKELITWVRSNRKKLVQCCLCISAGWVKAGSPTNEQASLPSFPRWARIMGGICQWAQLPGFLATQKSHLLEANEAAMERREILDELYRRHGEIANRDHHFYFNAIQDADILPRHIDDIPNNEKKQRKSFSYWMKKLWKNYPKCCGYELSMSTCKTLNKAVYSMSKIEQDVNKKEPERSEQLSGDTFRYKVKNEETSTLNRKVSGTEDLSGIFPVSFRSAETLINNSTSNRSPESRKDDQSKRDKKEKVSKKGCKGGHVGVVSHEEPVKGSSFRLSGDQSDEGVEKSNTPPPDLDADNPKVIHRIKQLEASIQIKKVLRQKKHVEKLQQDLEDLKARIKPAFSSPPVPAPPPTPEEIARRDREILDSGELGDILGEVMF